MGQITGSSANGGLDGVYDVAHKPNEYQTEDFGTIYRTQVSTRLEHTIGGERRHTKTDS
jgi:hypothetical protein